MEVEARSQRTRGNAAEALLRLAAHPREFEDMDSAAIDTLLQFNQRQTASINKAVQVNPGTVPSTCRTLIDLFHSDACVKAFTGVEDLRLFMVIANAVAEVDDMKAERSVLERVTIVLVRLKTSLSFRCSATLFSVSEVTVHRYFMAQYAPWQLSWKPLSHGQARQKCNRISLSAL